MNKYNDPAIDWLADVALTPDQRQTWNLMRSELINAREVIKDLEKRIKLLESTSPNDEQHEILTRPEFNREVARMLAFDERYGGISSVLYFNFDNLDSVAARDGKSVFNAAIREISNILMHNVRGSDVVGRLAPDEFGILLARCENGAAWKKGEQLSSALYEGLKEVHGCKLDLAISYGAYTFRDNEDISAGLKQAAQTMTSAKKSL